MYVMHYILLYDFDNYVNFHPSVRMMFYNDIAQVIKIRIAIRRRVVGEVVKDQIVVILYMILWSLTMSF